MEPELCILCLHSSLQLLRAALPVEPSTDELRYPGGQLAELLAAEQRGAPFRGLEDLLDKPCSGIWAECPERCG